MYTCFWVNMHKFVWVSSYFTTYLCFSYVFSHFSSNKETYVIFVCRLWPKCFATQQKIFMGCSLSNADGWPVKTWPLLPNFHLRKRNPSILWAILVLTERNEELWESACWRWEKSSCFIRHIIMQSYNVIFCFYLGYIYLKRQIIVKFFYLFCSRQWTMLTYRWIRYLVHITCSYLFISF